MTSTWAEVPIPPTVSGVHNLLRAVELVKRFLELMTISALQVAIMN